MPDVLTDGRVFMAGEHTLAVAAIGLPGARRALPDEPLPADAWDELLVEARFHKIGGLLARAIEEGALPATPDQRVAARTAHASSMELCLLLEADLLSSAALLRDRGVEYRVLKGPAFARLDYDDPSMRAFADIDLLVRSDQYDAAVAALVDAGYHRHYGEVHAGFDHRFGKGASFTGPNRRRQVDLHRTFVMGPFGLSIDLRELWSSGEQFDVGGQPFVALDREQRFLHACYHAAIGNARTRLVPLRDVATMALCLDAAELDRARSIGSRWRGEAVVARAVRLAWDALALDETDLSRWAAGYEVSAKDRAALRTYLDPGMGYAARSYAALRVLPTLGEKVAFTRALVFPDRRYGAGRHRGRWRRWREAARQIVALNRPRRRT